MVTTSKSILWFCPANSRQSLTGIHGGLFLSAQVTLIRGQFFKMFISAGRIVDLGERDTWLEKSGVFMNI